MKLTLLMDIDLIAGNVRIHLMRSQSSPVAAALDSCPGSEMCPRGVAMLLSRAAKTSETTHAQKGFLGLGIVSQEIG